jgi:hypothetical protein
MLEFKSYLVKFNLEWVMFLKFYLVINLQCHIQDTSGTHFSHLATYCLVVLHNTRM